MPRRSVLFSPGDQPDMLRKAPDSGADVVVFDLEDAVAPAAKADARETVNSVLQDIDPACEVCVRVNPTGIAADDDLAAILDGTPRLDSVMLPKVGGPDDVETLAALLAERDADIPILSLVESAEGVLAAESIAKTSDTDALLFGAEDFSADIGATRTDEGTEVLYARQRIVTAASAADIDAIDTLWTDFQDTDGLQADTQRGIEMGYDGKLAIHPEQVSVINEAFTPSPEQISWAERVLDARDNADGKGVFALDGEMIDGPLITQAEQIIERAEAADER